MDIGGLNGSNNHRLRFDLESEATKIVITPDVGVTAGVLYQAANADWQFYTFNTTAGFSSDLTFAHSNSAIIGTFTETVDNTVLGKLLFQGVHDGDALANSALIQVAQDGAAANSRVPTEILFKTASVDANVTTHLTITPTGALVAAPKEAPPTCNAAAEGGLFFDSDGTAGLCVCISSTWQPITSGGGAPDCS